MSDTARPVRQAVSLAIHRGAGHPGELLIIRRPADDEDLPDTWGLPAASLREDESWTDAVRRAARDKLGVEVEPRAVLNEGSLTRAAYTLHMRLYEAVIVRGRPAVPQRDPSVTQYQAWRWGVAGELRPGADAGSLCCRLLVETTER
jgi:ADP-ribose pyrophosphatase YjhB (NUDIX family)